MLFWGIGEFFEEFCWSLIVCWWMCFWIWWWVRICVSWIWVGEFWSKGVRRMFLCDWIECWWVVLGIYWNLFWVGNENFWRRVFFCGIESNFSYRMWEMRFVDCRVWCMFWIVLMRFWIVGCCIGVG